MSVHIPIWTRVYIESKVYVFRMLNVNYPPKFKFIHVIEYGQNAEAIGDIQ